MMNMKSVVKVALVLAVVFSATRAPAAATTQESISRTVVAKLTTFLASHGLVSLAAEDPSRPGHIVAVLHIPNVQLLVIAGRCESVAALRARLTAKAYQDVYRDLHGCAAADSRLFIQDLGADGLIHERPRDGAPFDIVYQQMTKQTKFDGNFKAQEISAQEYRQRYHSIDAEYARLVSLLLDGGGEP